ncbi:hypothetical protein AB0I53_20680 [Saccharopolyspora sp. NPDC050389]|uniref:hypothetical protein n=1 Tax=Saccharopolyspora sp. NPDC050389 TaxID=3155516 RepID=UPI00340DD671
MPDETSHRGDAGQVDRIATAIPCGVFATSTRVGHACLLLDSGLATRSDQCG